MLHYHGTSIRAARDILRDGFDPDSRANWTPSQNGVYFWSPHSLIELGECEEDDAEERAKYFAWGNSKCTLGRETECRGVVFGVDLDGLEVEPDLSCENMEGAVVHFGHIPADRIREIWVSEDFGIVRGYFIYQSSLLDQFINDFSDFELTVAKAFATIYVDEVEECELELVTSL